MARKKKEQATQEAGQNPPTKVVVGYAFSPDLLTINVQQLAFILYRIKLQVDPNIYNMMGDLTKHFQPVWGEAPPVENIKPESQGAEATAAST
jgi:hypothetical protein